MAFAIAASSCGQAAEPAGGAPRPDASGDAQGAVVTAGDGGPGDAAGTGPAAPVPTKNGLQSVWGSSETDVWAVGDAGTLLHFDGMAWTQVASGLTENLTSVNGTGADDVWATGDAGSVLHWDGASWKVASQVAETALLGVWADTPNDVWTVGIDFESGGLNGGSGFVHHWNGTTWDDSDVPGAETLWKVWGSGSTDVWMVGTEAGTGLIFRGDGTDFEMMDFTGDSVHGIWGSGPDDVWATPLTGPIQHWTGSAWAASPSLPAAGTLRSVSGSGRDDVWAVGDSGFVGHYLAGTWTPTPTPTTESLFAVWSSAPDKGWLVGSAGTALQWDGSRWK